MKPLFPNQPVTRKGDAPSQELIEVIHRLAGEVQSLRDQMDGIAAVTSPSGGATVDSEARTAIDAIRTAAG